MEKKTEIRKRIIFFLILSLVFLFAAIVIRYTSAHGENYIKSRENHVQEILTEKENKLKNILDEIVTGDYNQNTLTALWENKAYDLLQEEGITVFLYRNDSLTFWSNNTIPAATEKFLSSPFTRYGNGWFRVMEITKGHNRAIGLILIKSDYPYQNDYLVNDFHEDFKLDGLAALDTLPGNLNIHSNEGQFLFSLVPVNSSEISNQVTLIAFILSVFSFICIVLFLFYLYHLFDFFQQNPVLLYLAFCVDAIIFRFLLLYFEIPGFLYHTTLFGPYYFATSFISPSLGDLVINSFLWLTLAWLFYDKIVFSIRNYGKSNVITISFLLLMAVAFFYFMLISSLKRLVLDSNIELNLNVIFNLDVFSGLGFLAMSSMILAFFFMTSRLITIICQSGINPRIMIVLALISSGFTTILFLNKMETGQGLIFSAMLFIYLVSFLYFSKFARNFRSITGALVYIVFFSLIATYILDYYQEVKEKEIRKILAAKLASLRDPLMEYEFSKIQNQIVNDSALSVILNTRVPEKDDDSLILAHLNQKYFTNYWNKYDLFITVCHKDEMLLIQPGEYLSNCYAYFESRLKSPAMDNVSPGLYFLDNGMGNNSYLGVFSFKCDQPDHNDSLRIFVELFNKYIHETGLGYPELLIDKTVGLIDEASGYSYAKYVNGKLIYKNGDFLYNLGIQAYNKSDDINYFVDHEGYNHYVIKSDKVNTLIISKKNLTFLDLIAPFSYLFIVFSLILLVFLGGYVFAGGFNRFEFNFSNRLQLSIITIIIASFLILGMISRSNIIHLYNDKNRDNLSEKAFSVLTELEHKLGNETVIADDLREYISGILYKFSMIFYSDINLFDTEGTLIASSRPEIFKEKLLSEKMNTRAFYKMTTEQSLLYIQNEKIGKQEYLSAYIPFRNVDDQIIAYINLPYFAKQSELQKEIGDFLAAYINVYVLLIVLAIMVTILVSRFITRPLQLIREKLGNIGLGKSNEKIEWTRNDEIGSLVEEYNRMIDELAKSAELLARSERESAWREMAKQVAHEIKNPLTPMKLSVQYLQKTWDDKSPDWEKHLKRFTRTIVEQIDSLSEIASEFSDFAKMPTPVMEKIELGGVVRSAAELFLHHRHIEISILNADKEYFVMADGKQLLRVFNNLIQNAVQAIGNREGGMVQIRLSEENAYYSVNVTDNGSGITAEQATRIFSPSFTTKSSGMGLGLAMVKSIITSVNGTVSFESTPGVGTTFILHIPVCKE